VLWHVPQGPSDYTIAQIKDAIRDGLRAVKNTLEDGSVVPGAGAFELALAKHLREELATVAIGRAKLGVEAVAEAFLGIVKVLAENAGFDAHDVIIALQREAEDGNAVGLDVETGGAIDPALSGIFDNYRVKQQLLQSAPIIATQLLLVDEVMRCGVNMRRG
jgi:T-complex protein 1 subunit zeta